MSRDAIRQILAHELFAGTRSARIWRIVAIYPAIIRSWTAAPHRMATRTTIVAKIDAPHCSLPPLAGDAKDNWFGRGDSLEKASAVSMIPVCGGCSHQDRGTGSAPRSSLRAHGPPARILPRALSPTHADLRGKRLFLTWCLSDAQGQHSHSSLRC